MAGFGFHLPRCALHPARVQNRSLHELNQQLEGMDGKQKAQAIVDALREGKILGTVAGTNPEGTESSENNTSDDVTDVEFEEVKDDDK